MTESTTRRGAGTAGAPAASPPRPPEGPFLLVGLGNPGPGYAGNRHNVGAMVLAELAARAGTKLTPGKGPRARSVSGDGRLAGRRVVLAQPTTYMNESGGPVQGLLGYHSIDPTCLVVVHDELDLDFDVVRVDGRSNDVAAGLVMDVSPTGNQPYGSTVTLTVSQGPVQVTVPDVGGQTLEEATATLTAAGLQVTSSTFITGDRVVRQSPGAGEVVDEGTTVNLLLSFI